jgi:hypothetical protein
MLCCCLSSTIFELEESTHIFEPEKARCMKRKKPSQWKRKKNTRATNGGR